MATDPKLQSPEWRSPEINANWNRNGNELDLEMDSGIVNGNGCDGRDNCGGLLSMSSWIELVWITRSRPDTRGGDSKADENPSTMLPNRAGAHCRKLAKVLQSPAMETERGIAS